MNRSRIAPALFCISSALLGYELLLMRLLSLAEWGHFAGFIISIAMLGLAASGLFLHFYRDRIIARTAWFFAGSAAMFAITGPLAFAIVQRLQFTPFLLTWSPQEYWLLVARVVLFFVPLFFSGVAVGSFFVARALPAPRLYFWNMLGSAAPCLLLPAGLTAFAPVKLLVPIAALGMIAALVVLRSRWVVAAGTLAAIALCAAVARVPFHYSPYKDLSRTLNLPEARVMETRHSALGIVQSVESPSTRYLPGLSLNFMEMLPSSKAIFVDGSGMEMVFDAGAALENPAFLKMAPEAFAYRLHQSPEVLLIETPPVELLRALAHEAGRVVVVDPIAERVRMRDRIGRGYGEPPSGLNRVEVIIGEPRHFLRRSSANYSLVFLPLLGSHAASTAGAASLDPAYAFTVESLSLVMDRLHTNGHLVMTTWVENPPRAGVRLAALILEVLRATGKAAPEQHLLAIRSWSTLTFFVSAAPVTQAEIARLREFASENSFDLVCYPGIRPDEANRINLIPDAPYFSAIQHLLGAERERYYARSLFAVKPPRDDKPFFGHYFRWEALPSLVAATGGDWVPYVEWGYLLQTASLVVAAILGIVLLLVPCALTRTRPGLSNLVLFFALGVAYMFVELWAIYKMTFLLSSPTYAAALVLTAMLASSGAGALLLNRNAHSAWATIPLLLCAVLVLAAASFRILQEAVYPEPLAVRFLVGGLWIALPAFLMGFPFPFALGRLRRQAEIPWALALNGFGSVLGSLGATLVAVHFGLSILALAAIAAYAAVAVILFRQYHVSDQRS